MKTISSLTLIIILSAFAMRSSAIEGLRISVISTNAVLTWPSTNDGETYLVQYRSNLTSTAWTTIADYLPASGSNTITFIDVTNTVTFGNVGTNSSGGGGVITPPPPGGSDTNDVDGTNATMISYTGFYRVVRDGIHLWGITNGMVISNVLETSMEIAVTNADEITGISFYDTNNYPLIGASAQKNGSNQWIMVWDTTMFPNGSDAIIAELDFGSDDPIVSQPVSITVSNLISFPNYLTTTFGSEMWIYAQTIPNAAYEIDMYDQNTNYLGSFDDYADGNGIISFIWDLTDGNGNTYDSTNFIGVFSINASGQADALPATPKPSRANFQAVSSQSKSLSRPAKVHPNGLAATSPASTMKLWSKEPKWTPNNNWVVAYAPLVNPTANPDTVYDESLMMLGGEDQEEGPGVIGTLNPADTGGNLSPGNIPETSAFEMGDANSRAQLLTYLANQQYKNFYFFGHGNNNCIAAYDATGVFISADQLAYALGNVPLSYSAGPPHFDQGWDPDLPTMVPTTVNPDIQTVALHPYRFVFLDGCETAGGNISESFGIPSMELSTNSFAAAGLESRAFLGYTRPINFNVGQWTWRSIMLAGFFQDWLDQVPVENCVGNAQAAAHSDGFQPMDWSATVYGAYDMNINTRTRP